jgi:hypothetical protein
MDLAQYEQHKFAIAEILRSAAAVVPDERADWRERIQKCIS